MRRAAIWGNAVASLAVDPTGRRAALSDARGEMAVLNIGNGAFRALPAVDITPTDGSAPSAKNMGS